MKNYRIGETFVYHGPNGPGNYFRIQRPAVTHTEIGRITDDDGEDMGPDTVAARYWDDVTVEREVREGPRVRKERYTPYFTTQDEAKAFADSLK
jgi:hypothetical protein